MSVTYRGGDKLHPYAEESLRVGAKYIFARFCLLFFLLIFALDSRSAEKKSAPALTMNQIANTTLSINFNGDANKQKVKLKNGHYERRKKGSDTLWVDLTTWVKFTDLDKDGAGDAVVIYVWNKGGEEIFYELAALLNKKGKPVQVSSADLGDRVVIQALEVSADTVFLNMLTRGKGDANCCPTLPVKLSYLLEEGKLVEQTNYLGIYKGKIIYHGAVFWNVSMLVNRDYTLNMIIPAVDLEPTIMMTGKWYKKGDGSLLVDFSEGSGWPSGAQIVFRFLNNKLTSMLNYDDIYGKRDLEFERVSQ